MSGLLAKKNENFSSMPGYNNTPQEIPLTGHLKTLLILTQPFKRLIIRTIKRLFKNTLEDKTK
jgi:hypothetical protein